MNLLQKKLGFSLIETLIAVSILMIAIAGPLTLVQAGLFSSNHQRNEITAIYLAQEALEYIKNVRDSNAYSQYTAPVDWLTGPNNSASMLDTCLSDPANSHYGCYVDPHGNLSNGNAFIQKILLPPTSSQYLKLTSVAELGDSPGATTKMYSYDNNSGAPTIYKRTVTISGVEDSKSVTGYDEVIVIATVTWTDNSVPRSYSVSTNLFNYAQSSIGNKDNGNQGGGGDGGGGNPDLIQTTLAYGAFGTIGYCQGGEILSRYNPPRIGIGIWCDASNMSTYPDGNYLCNVYEDVTVTNGSVDIYAVPIKSFIQPVPAPATYKNEYITYYTGDISAIYAGETHTYTTEIFTDPSLGPSVQAGTANTITINPNFLYQLEGVGQCPAVP